MSAWTWLYCGRGGRWGLEGVVSKSHDVGLFLMDVLFCFVQTDGTGVNHLHGCPRRTLSVRPVTRPIKTVAPPPTPPS
jgi:hypothetical protein